MLSLFLLSSTLYAQDLPAPSPVGSVKQKLGLTDIEIIYSRPGVKKRKVFGELVPFGEIWRTGANKATSFYVSTEVQIMGNTLPAGTYSVFTIPGLTEWDIIFNSNTELWGTEGRKPEEDVLTIRLKSEKTDFTESMLFYMDDLKDETGSIIFKWEETKLTIPVSVKVRDEAIKNIDKSIAEANGTFRIYNNSARYYLDNNIDAKKALEWAEKSVSMDKKYWNLTVLSRAQAANGLKAEAIKTAEEAKILASDAGNNAYIKQNEDNINLWKSAK